LHQDCQVYLENFVGQRILLTGNNDLAG
jgi:hypothetical protein